MPRRLLKRLCPTPASLQSRWYGKVFGTRLSDPRYDQWPRHVAFSPQKGYGVIIGLTTIGAATVYRTMKILTDAGLASARHFEGGQTRYEAALDRHHHDHLICTGCSRIIEFENEQIEELQDRVADEHGFRVTHHKLELYGLCRDCQATQSRQRTL